MVKARLGVKIVSSCLLVWVGAHTAQAAPPPSVAQMLGFHPKQSGINYSTPTGPEINLCKVERVNGTRPGCSGWLLRDSTGRPLRRYFDGNGDNHVDTWSYFLEGLEVYREIDSNGNQKVDQYRWLNANGMKWGVDINEDGKIDAWKAISAEEVSQEVLQAFVGKDLARIQALMISDAEVKALEMSANEAARIGQLRSNASAKFQASLAKLAGLGEKTRWVRYDANLPQCVPAEQGGTKIDLLKQVRGTILYETNGKHDFMPIGELILVGHAWRLIDVPGDSEQPESPQLKAKLEELRKLDAVQPSTPADVVRYNMQRAELIQAIIPLDKAEQRDTWKRQLVECYSAAAQSSPDTDKSAYDLLQKLAQQLAKEQPGAPMASFATFREMQAWYAAELAKIKDPNGFPKVQGKWLDRLTEFVQAYPRTDETPEAYMQLGMVSEFISKEVEAKNWYGKLVKEFPNHPLAAKGEGAIRRLEIEGKPFALASSGPGTPFDITRLKGKLVIVYYWASWNQQCIGDFAQLKVMLSKYGSKGLELVCINVDNGPPEANAPAPPGGVAVTQPGGLDSPLAIQYGIHSLPTMFLVDTDGKAISGKVQVGSLDDELKKRLK